ncbi:MAG TPA: hypothetical protein VHX11_05580 [Acidobacteriaceae bacterium]|jgi:hypothetical protein|nr:hypothetical protein [Acidobacteriaceae bacterium]
MAPVALLAHLASTELHESFHFVVGRLAGLPSHFLNLTSVGVDPSVAANASSAALALMNGVAPLTTMLLGIVALAAVPALRSKVPPAVTAFVAWWAIVGVPYIGLQTMTTAGPVRLRGNGSDFAAVLGGYFGVPILPRTAIAVAGLVIFMASGFCLGAAVSPRTVGALSRLTLAQRLGGLARWRVVVASGLSLLLIAMTVRGATLAAHGNGGGLLLLLEGAWVWAALMALLVRWRAPGAREVRDHWIFPGLLASAGLIAISLLTHLFDFFIGGAMFVVPLIATAWIQTRASAELPEWETN